MVVNLVLDDETRKQLALSARRSSSRKSPSTPKRPARWHPTEVRTPNEFTFDYFTDPSAWDFIATKLEEGHPVEVIPMKKPPNSTGYVMKICLQADIPLLYVKLELVGGTVYGRSFHLSDYP